MSRTNEQASMNGKQPAAKRQATTVVLGGEEKGELRQLGGSLNDTFNNFLLNALGSTLWAPAGQSETDRTSQCTAAVVALRAFAPSDEIEAMLAAQALGLHNAAIECLRRAMLPDQPFELAQGYRKSATNMSRTYVELLSALDRKRGKGTQQRVTVEHVHLHSGAQAIVGAVAPGAAGGGGAPSRIQEGPHASPAALAHDPALGAVMSPLRSSDPEWEPLPASGDEQRPVPPPRRAEHGAANGRGN